MEALLLALVIVAGVCQTGFVVLWATLPFWREWVGRALMVESAALMLFLDSELLQVFVPALRHPWMDVGTFALVALGIVLQLLALGHEIFKAKARSRAVGGTTRRG